MSDWKRPFVHKHTADDKVSKGPDQSAQAATLFLRYALHRSHGGTSVFLKYVKRTVVQASAFIARGHDKRTLSHVNVM